MDDNYNIDEEIPRGLDVDAEFARASALKQPVPRPLSPMIEESAIRSESEGWLTIDVYQTPAEIVVESAVAGVNPDDLDITATSDSVSIKGERVHEKEVRDEDYLYQECYWGRFSRSVILPQEVDPEAAVVRFRNGILTIRLPKVTKNKAKKLKVARE